MTANAMASDRELCLATGMNDHIGKPFVVAQMVEVIARHVARARRSQEMDRPALSVAPAAIDIDDALSRTLGDRELLEMVMAEFVARYADVGSTLARLLAEGTLDELSRKAHDLKGVAGNLGARTLAKAAASLQRAAESGSAEQAGSACREIARLLPAVIAEAKRIAAA